MRRARRGFTLIEVLVTMSILALLLALAAPAMGTYVQNSKLAAVTSSIYAAVQTARAEAIRRNVQAQFVLTDTPVSTADIANTLVPAVAGRNWVVRAASGAAFEPIESKAGAEGAATTVAPAVQVAGAASAPVAFDGTIPFNGFGQPPTGVRYALEISNPSGGLCAVAGGPIRCRRIVVSAGGQITACDPAAPAGDSRAC